MDLKAFDDRKIHLLTRGNVDGIICAALYLHKIPDLKVSFTPSGDAAVDVMRKDLSSTKFILTDLGLTPRLLKTFRDKRGFPQEILYLDHHAGSLEQASEIPDNVDSVIDTSASAASVVFDHLGLGQAHAHLVALADQVEFCKTPMLDHFEGGRLENEAKTLDFSWRQKVEDDRFRYYAARKLATGAWPSEVSEIRARYLTMVNEGRWERALEKVRTRMTIQQEVALVQFGRHKPSLFGFGSRAVSEVARQEGAKVALLMNKRKDLSTLSLRRTDPNHDLDLGQMATEFTMHNGIVGGGHPHAAGAKIPTKYASTFLKELLSLA
ncbi:MAG: DHHA1 domain-containing protein [Thermoplasmatota archaeon]